MRASQYCTNVQPPSILVKSVEQKKSCDRSILRKKVAKLVEYLMGETTLISMYIIQISTIFFLKHSHHIGVPLF